MDSKEEDSSSDPINNGRYSVSMDVGFSASMEM